MYAVDVFLIFFIGCIVGFLIGFAIRFDWKEFWNYQLEKEKMKLYSEMQYIKGE